MMRPTLSAWSTRDKGAFLTDKGQGCNWPNLLLMATASAGERTVVSGEPFAP